MSDERVTPGKTPVANLQKHIARYNLALQFCDGKEVLDIACGTGYGTNMLSWVAKMVIGVDISSEAIKIAKSRYSGPGVMFLELDLLEFDIARPADTVISFETIEHIEDLQATQEKLSSLLKPGGTIVYSVPLHESYENEHHHHKFTLETGLTLFPEFHNTSYVVQKGINFVGKDLCQPFTYLVVSKTK